MNRVWYKPAGGYSSVQNKYGSEVGVEVLLQLHVTYPCFGVQRVLATWWDAVRLELMGPVCWCLAAADQGVVMLANKCYHCCSASLVWQPMVVISETGQGLRSQFTISDGMWKSLLSWEVRHVAISG